MSFRFALLYLLLYSHPFPISWLPNPASVTRFLEIDWPIGAATDPVFEVLGDYAAWVRTTERDLVDAASTSLFGFDGPLERPQASGDPTYTYVLLSLHLGAAALGTALWSLLARRSRGHRRLAPWLQLYARYFLAFPMFSYGFAKIFPSQFSEPRLAELLSNFGDSTPMHILWFFMGSSAAYTVFAGAGEVLAGALLCFRRTATLGALVTVGVMGNVAALNFSYDVPVKVFSSHLLIVALLLAAADGRRLAAILVFNRSAPGRDLSAPRFPLLSGHLLKLLIVGPTVLFGVARVWKSYAEPVPPGEHFGVWDVERFVDDGTELAERDAPWRALVLERENPGRQQGWIQLADHSLRFTTPRWNIRRTRLTLSGGGSWVVNVDGDRMVAQGEFLRSFRPNPFDRSDPGELRGPQIERVLVREAGGADGGEDPAVASDGLETPGETGAAIETGESEEDDESLPDTLLGRWSLETEAMVGDAWNSRRQDPAGWSAVRFESDGSAHFEDADGHIESYEATWDPERNVLKLAWESRFKVEQARDDADVPTGLTLRGDHRGRELEVELRRRDLDSFLLRRRGFNWINEIPMNRF